MTDRTRFASPYGANHMRLRARRGRACLRLCAAGCTRQAMDWALIHGKDGADPASYMPLCRSCHWQYDHVGQQAGVAKRSASPAWIASRRAIPRDSLGRWSAE